MRDALVVYRLERVGNLDRFLVFTQTNRAAPTGISTVLNGQPG